MTIQSVTKKYYSGGIPGNQTLQKATKIDYLVFLKEHSHFLPYNSTILTRLYENINALSENYTTYSLIKWCAPRSTMVKIYLYLLEMCECGYGCDHQKMRCGAQVRAKQLLKCGCACATQ